MSLQIADYDIVEMELRIERSFALDLAKLNLIASVVRDQLGDSASFIWIRGQKYITFFPAEAGGALFATMNLTDATVLPALSADSSAAGVATADEAAPAVTLNVRRGAQAVMSDPIADAAEIAAAADASVAVNAAVSPANPFSPAAYRPRAVVVPGRRLYVLSALTPGPSTSIATLLATVQTRASAVAAAVQQAVGATTTATEVNQGVYPAQCQNRIRDSNETDIDCGSPTCDQCFGGSECRVSSNCNSLHCLQLPAANPSLPSLACTFHLVSAAPTLGLAAAAISALVTGALFLIG
jgi:hypothetical protein